jgi:hypothetical protein
VVLASDSDALPITSTTLATEVTLDLVKTAVEATATDVASLDGKFSLGAQLAAASVSVVLASNQAAVPISSATLATEATLGTVSSDIAAMSVDVADILANLEWGQRTSADSLSVVLSSDQAAVPISSATLATEVTLASVLVDTSASKVSLASVDSKLAQGQQNMAGSLSVVIASNQTGIPITSATLATEATLGAVATDVGTVATNSTTLVSRILQGQQTMAISVGVVLSSTQSDVPMIAAGKTCHNRVRIDYSSTSVLTSAYTQVLASTSSAISEVEIFDSSGNTMILATGAPSSEGEVLYIVPGGNGRVPVKIASGTRVAIKALSGNATSGEIVINFYGA